MVRSRKERDKETVTCGDTELEVDKLETLLPGERWGGWLPVVAPKL